MGNRTVWTQWSSINKGAHEQHFAIWFAALETKYCRFAWRFRLNLPKTSWERNTDSWSPSYLTFFSSASAGISSTFWEECLGQGQLLVQSKGSWKIHCQASYLCHQPQSIFTKLSQALCKACEYIKPWIQNSVWAGLQLDVNNSYCA